VGALAGLVEVCWTYLLPTIFQGRRYVLPTSTVGWYVAVAVLTDVVLALAAALVLGLVIRLLWKLWPRTAAWRTWPLLIRIVLLSGMLSYLLGAYVFIYYFFGDGSSKTMGAVVGALIVTACSALIGVAIEFARRRLGRTAPTVSWAVAMLAAAVTFVTCYFGYRAGIVENRSSTKLTGAPLCNILLVTLDTTRADFLGCYGNPIVQTPTLDALAADGVLFDHAISQAPTTTPSHCSLMTGTYASRNGAINGAAMRGDLPTLAEVLQENGYDTAAFVSSTMVRSTNSGLDRGFDYYEDSMCLWTPLLRHDEAQFVVAFYLLARLQGNQVPARVVSDRAVEWLNRPREAPFFCWLHYYDPHDPYRAPEPYRNMYQGKIPPDPIQHRPVDRYAGEITYVDAQLGRVIESLKARGLYDDATIVVTADHGEAFGEKHGEQIEFGHGNHLYDTTQHVPLLVKLPGGAGAGRRVEDVVQLADVAPTLVELLGGVFPDTCQGHSFAVLLRGGQRSEPGVAYSERVKLPHFGDDADSSSSQRLMAMRTLKLKYICDDSRQRQEMYEVFDDPGETVNILLDRLDLADAVYESMVATLGRHSETQTPGLDPAVLAQLQALGYIGGRDEEKEPAPTEAP